MPARSVRCLFGLLVLSACAGRLRAFSTDPYHHLVNLFNALYSGMGDFLRFDYDFGSGVPLLHDMAWVYIFSPFDILPRSTMSYLDNKTKLCTIELKSKKYIAIYPNRGDQPWLFLEGCHLELKYTVNNSSGLDVRPRSVWLDDCDRISLFDGRQPDNGEQVLPLVTEALYRMAQQHFTFHFDEPIQDALGMEWKFKTLQTMLPELLYRK